jgi:hypothetical protein
LGNYLFAEIYAISVIENMKKEEKFSIGNLKIFIENIEKDCKNKWKIVAKIYGECVSVS